MSDVPHWRRLSDLFDGAMERPAAEREAWLEAECPDPALREDVRRLLAAQEVTGVLDRPVLAATSFRDQLERGLEGRYSIEREIGRGGMATVYLAREHKHERLVVLKVLKPEFASAYGERRFLREVRLTARLAHPHILAFIDSGQVGDPPLLFYVMPYVGGETLRERLRRERALEPGAALVLLRDLADALAYAHRAGIVHRDIKPENVLCVGGHAYLLDFGIATLPEPPITGEHLTAEGTAIGTAGYMSPEQAAGAEAKFPADIYAWGVVAREMLTGAGPAHLSLDRAVLPAGVPPACAKLINDALSPDPEVRPFSSALLDTLNACVTPSGDSGPRAALTAPVRTRRALAGAVIVLASVAAFASWNARRGPAEPPAEPGVAGALPAPVAVAPLVNETGDSSLAAVGRLAGDWITQGIQHTGVVSVVPWPYALQAAAGTDGAGRVAAMRRETGAGTVVTGAYYLTGDRLRFQVEITDALRGRLIGAPAPVEAPRDSIAAAILMLRERVMGAMAVRADERLGVVPGVADRPPTFEAYRAFDRGVSRQLAQDYRAAAAEFHAAFALDTTFALPLVYEALARSNLDEFARADSLLAEVRRRRMALSEYHDLLAQYLAAHLEGDAGRALAVIRRAAAAAPGSQAPYNLALTALMLDRPREALASLRSLDPDRGPIRGWPSYWTQLAHAHHLLGAHDLERGAAREMQRRHPALRVPLALEARALAATGNAAAIDSLIDAASALPPDTYWSQGGAMVIAAEELAAHGHAGSARRLLERAVSWLANQLAREPAHQNHRLWMGTALYDLGRWGDAKPYFESLVADVPDRITYRGYAALVDARLGGRHPERRLGADPPYERTTMKVYRARLAAIRGDTAAAVATMSEAIRLGIQGFAWVHGSAHADFAGLAGSPGWHRLFGGEEAPARLE